MNSYKIDISSKDDDPYKRDNGYGFAVYRESSIDDEYELLESEDGFDTENEAKNTAIEYLVFLFS